MAHKKQKGANQGQEIRVLAFGTDNDPVAWQVADRLAANPEVKGIQFVKTDSPDDITKIVKEAGSIIIMDAARGIDKPCLLSIDGLKDSRAVTTHDLDLGLTLKLLQKTGRLDGIDVKIIGIPKDSRLTDGLVEEVKRILAEI